MINERMLELLILNSVLSELPEKEFKKDSGILKLNTGEVIDGNKLYERYYELIKEFLSPYVINKNSKE